MPGSKQLEIAFLDDSYLLPGDVRHGDGFTTDPRSVGLPEKSILADLGQPTLSPFPAPGGISL